MNLIEMALELDDAKAFEADTLYMIKMMATTVCFNVIDHIEMSEMRFDEHIDSLSLPSRVFAVLKEYQVLTTWDSSRVVKGLPAQCSPKLAFDELRKKAGKELDPDVVEKLSEVFAPSSSKPQPHQGALAAVGVPHLPSPTFVP